jgi:hypothetical protein
LCNQSAAKEIFLKHWSEEKLSKEKELKQIFEAFEFKVIEEAQLKALV